MKKSSGNNVTAINQSNVRNDGSTVHDLIERDKRIEPGRASPIRTALDFGFRSSVCSDVIERLKTVEKNRSGAAKQ